MVNRNQWPSGTDDFFKFFGKNEVGRGITSAYAPGALGFTQSKEESKKNLGQWTQPGRIKEGFDKDPLGTIGNILGGSLTAPKDIVGSIFGSDKPKYPWDNLPGGREQYMANALEQNKTNYWNMFLTKNANLSTQGSTQQLSTALSEGIPRLRLGNPDLAEQLSGRIKTILSARAQPGRRQTILANPLQRL